MTSEHSELTGKRLWLARIYDIHDYFSYNRSFLNAITTRMALFDPCNTIRICTRNMYDDGYFRGGKTISWLGSCNCPVYFSSLFKFRKILPFPLWHRGYDIDYVVDYTYLTTEGVFGVPIGKLRFPLVLFDLSLVASGGDFTDFARALTGRSIGGAAKTAVVFSPAH